jgi:hypothetical protein
LPGTDAAGRQRVQNLHLPAAKAVSRLSGLVLFAPAARHWQQKPDGANARTGCTAAGLPNRPENRLGDSKKRSVRFNFRACRGAWCDSKTSIADKSGLCCD